MPVKLFILHVKSVCIYFHGHLVIIQLKITCVSICMMWKLMTEDQDIDTLTNKLY